MNSFSFNSSFQQDLNQDLKSILTPIFPYIPSKEQSYIEIQTRTFNIIHKNNEEDDIGYVSEPIFE